MATTKDWTANTPAADQLKGLTHPSAPRYFADGDASDWCVHEAPGVYGAVSVRNMGTGTLYVGVGPHLSGSAASASTSHAYPLATGEERLFSLAGGVHDKVRFSTFGADGAAHVMHLVFELQP